VYSGDQPGSMARSRFQPIPGFLVPVSIFNLHLYCSAIILAVKRENGLDKKNFCTTMVAWERNGEHR